MAAHEAKVRKEDRSAAADYLKKAWDNYEQMLAAFHASKRIWSRSRLGCISGFKKTLDSNLCLISQESSEPNKFEMWFATFLNLFQHFPTSCNVS